MTWYIIIIKLILRYKLQPINLQKERMVIVMNNKIILYGCSEQGFVEYDYLKNALPDREYAFCATEKTEENYNGIPVISLRELYLMDREKTEIYVYDDDELSYEKKERLELAGFKNVYSCTPGIEKYYDIIWGIPGIQKELGELFEELYFFVYCKEKQVRLRRMHNGLDILAKIMRISEAYNILEDEESRQTFCDVLRYRISGRNEFLERRFVPTQYFLDDIFDFTEHEIFIDGGAAQGDTILGFANHVSGRYEKIYAFEAKRSYCIGMEELFRDKNVEVVKKGLYSHECVLYFHENQHGSSVSEEKVSEQQIEVTSIDGCLDDKVTFIKMDIEGSELKALDGARNIIKECKPKLAICAYHLEEDLWEVPLKIKEILPEYKIYMRHHCTEMDEETVCYAKI